MEKLAALAVVLLLLGRIALTWRRCDNEEVGREATSAFLAYLQKENIAPETCVLDVYPKDASPGPIWMADVYNKQTGMLRFTLYYQGRDETPQVVSDA